MICKNSNCVTVHAYVPSNGICRGFAFKYGKFLLPPRFLTALSVPKVLTREQYFQIDKIRCHNWMLPHFNSENLHLKIAISAFPTPSSLLQLIH